MKPLSKTTALALSLFLMTTGCATTNVSMEQTSNNNNEASNSNNEASASNSNTEAPSSEPPSSNSQASSIPPPDSSQPTVPTGFILEPNCDKGTGSTGLDIYYMEPSSDPQRFVCVHRTGMSPYINNDDMQLDQKLSEVGGGYCVYSWVSNNVGCALSPITKQDLMNPPPQEVGVPAGYVLEDCQQGTGATGKTIYYRPYMPPRGANHGLWYECVHPAGARTTYNVIGGSGGRVIVGDDGPYCAFSTVSNNIGCALEPITSKDLMNPS
jgi:hypothetical protein